MRKNIFQLQKHPFINDIEQIQKFQYNKNSQILLKESQSPRNQALDESKSDLDLNTINSIVTEDEI